MKSSKKNYFCLYQNLDIKRKEYFHILSENQESILFEIALILRRSSFNAESDLFDLKHFFRFSYRSRASMFNNYDVLVLETLEVSDCFNKLVATQTEIGLNSDYAVIQVFLEECLHSFLGEKWSPIANYLDRFQKWKKDRGFTALSKEEIRDRYNQIMAGWTLMPTEENDAGAKNYAISVLSGPCLRFIYDCCYTSRDRQLALLILVLIFDRIWPLSAEAIMSTLTDFYYDPDFTEKKLMTQIDLIRRRLAAYILIEGIPYKLPKDNQFFTKQEYYAKWLLDVAGVDNLEEAKKLISTCIMAHENTSHNDLNYAQAIDDLAGMFRKKGILCQIKGTRKSPILLVWQSLYERIPSERPEVQVFSPGVYYKDGIAKSIKELI